MKGIEYEGRGVRLIPITRQKGHEMNVIYRKTRAYIPLTQKQDKTFNTLLRDAQRVGLDLATMYVSKFERAPTTFKRQLMLDEMISLFFGALKEDSSRECVCDRCDAVVAVDNSHISDLNFQTICDLCSTEERERPDYEEGKASVEASDYEVMYLPTNYKVKVVRDV